MTSLGAPERFDRWSTAAFASALFTSATLMFLVQPMFAKALLPLLGGAPAVWNTCVVFYELILLAGYYYAYVLQQRATLRAQLAIHAALVIAVLVFLPLRVLSPLAPPTSVTAVPWVLITLLVSLGVPLLVLSATSPLLQSWFARTPNRRASDPYFLYAASNAGSMLGLLAYPFALEPLLGLRSQSLIWSVGYLLLAGSLGLCGLIAYRTTSELGGADAAHDALPDAVVSTRRKIRWVVLAFIPASLMLSVTSYISADVAPIPLLWVIPLALYLLTLVIAFSGDSGSRLKRLYLTAPFAMLLLVVVLAADVSWPALLRILIHLGAFFLIALTCHTLLAADRPSRTRLTEFYLWLAVGGALGGIFNAIIAPYVFRDVYEYPIVLVLAAFFMRGPDQPESSRPRLWNVELPLLLGAALAAFIWIESRLYGHPIAVHATAAFLAAALIALLAFRQRVGFAVSVATLLLCGLFLDETRHHNLYLGRDFFGVKTVFASGNYHHLWHNSTTHGIENMLPEERDRPLSYYTRSGPLGQIFSALQPELRNASIAVVGEGAGSALCYHLPTQRWTIYEIDPQIDLIARDPRLFDYLPDCAGPTPTVIGDARLSLGRAPDSGYSLLILDAYSSDYVPLHLLTREALSLYIRKLTDDGVLAFHISSRWFDLEPVLTSLATDAGLQCYVNHDANSKPIELLMGKRISTWIALGAKGGNIRLLASDPRWQQCPATKFRVWTDDYSSLVTAFSLRVISGSQ
ncbi:MAG TPA: fused MFS/spermidine synthase [Candidatus Eremiobacteraceae bacterium]|nr:fused MFS/spermidine synthase [Candidatus Eremiobacteraceae bacterium]